MDVKVTFCRFRKIITQLSTLVIFGEDQRDYESVFFSLIHCSILLPSDQPRFSVGYRSLIALFAKTYSDAKASCTRQGSFQNPPVPQNCTPLYYHSRFTKPSSHFMILPPVTFFFSFSFVQTKLSTPFKSLVVTRTVDRKR